MYGGKVKNIVLIHKTKNTASTVDSDLTFSLWPIMKRTTTFYWVLFLIFVSSTGCMMNVEITKNQSETPEIQKSEGSELTGGSNSQKTSRGYFVDSQVGHSFGQVVSKTDKNFTIYHSVKIGSSVE